MDTQNIEEIMIGRKNITVMPKQKHRDNRGAGMISNKYIFCRCDGVVVIIIDFGPTLQA